MHWYMEVLRKYAEFGGRARRSEYWWFVLINTLASFALLAVDMFVGTGFLYYLYALAVLIPSLAVGVRRLHDTGRSGWWLLIAFIPLIGAIILLVFLFQDSEPGTNQYGPNPKQVAAPTPAAHGVA